MTPTAVTSSDHSVPVEDGNLFVREWMPSAVGADEPIVMLHDSIGCVELWRDFPERLCAATSRRIIAYDRLGFGRSDPYPGPIAPDFVVAESARFLPAVLRARDVHNPVLFGHSVGGGMAIVAAAKLGARCRALIAESAQVFAEPRTFEGVRQARPLFAPGSVPYERLKKYHGDKTDWALGAWIDSWLDPAFADFTLASDLRRVRCPVLAIHGDRDEYGSTAHAQMICDLVAGPATLKIFPGLGHVPHREQPEAVLAAITQVLS